jgi:hypothetical protein
MRKLLSTLSLRGRLSSLVCQSKHFESRWYRRWAMRIARGGPDINLFGPEFAHVFRQVWDAMAFDGAMPRFRHRKMWEWCAIAEVLDEAGLLTGDREGCGFAVGHEPLAALFAAYGARILATDLDAAQDQGWSEAGQNAQSLDGIYWPNLISRELFNARATFQPVDMRVMDNLEHKRFDFVWSSCALEHLGTLQDGLDFVERATHILKPGGLGVHTTEFNVSSEHDTIEVGDNVLYRHSDFEALASRLERCGARLRPLNLDVGAQAADRQYDEPPYYVAGRQHVKLLIGPFVSTSILLVVEKHA